MSAMLDKLLFRIGLVDNVTGPVGRVQKSIKTMTASAKRGFAGMAYGAAGLAGVGYTVERLIRPARELDKALGETASLGVADDALKGLQKTALNFSMQYGRSAADFIRASYDIQSAIGGLKGDELAQFTSASGILAAATKADIGTITSYVGTMYGIFQSTADQMGRAKWVQLLAGQTAQAVKMFKTTGTEMESAFSNLGAAATVAGRPMYEQIAILGQLQAAMPGSRAATGYRAFLAGVGKAQQIFNVSLTDSSGHMLGMVDILDKLKQKIGDVSQTSAQDKLAKAFGREGVQVVTQLIGKTGQLAENISAIGDVHGLKNAIKMARAATDPFDLLGRSLDTVLIVFGEQLIPVLRPVSEWMISVAKTLSRWSDLFPNVSRYVGYFAAAVLGLVAAFSVFLIVGGLVHLTIAGTTGLMLGAKGVATALRFSIGALSATWRLFQLLMIAGAAALDLLRTAFMGSTVATWLFNTALFSNPIIWIVGLVIALGVAIGALIYYWDDVVKALKRFGLAMLEKVAGPLKYVIALLNKIPGVDIDVSAIDRLTAGVSTGPSIDTGPTPTVPKGGLQQQLTTGPGGGSVYNVTLQHDQPMGPQDFTRWMELNAP